MRLIVDKDAFAITGTDAYDNHVLDAKVRHYCNLFKPDSIAYVSLKDTPLTDIASWAYRTRPSAVDTIVLTCPGNYNIWLPVVFGARWHWVDHVAWLLETIRVPNAKATAKRIVERHTENTNSDLAETIVRIWSRSKTLKDFPQEVVYGHLLAAELSMWQPAWEPLHYPEAEQTDRHYHVVDTPEAAQELRMRIALHDGHIALDFETDGLEGYPFLDPVGMSICMEPGTAYYVPITHQHDRNLDARWARTLAEYVASRKWIAHNAPFEYHILLNMGVDKEIIKCPRDTMMLLYHDGQQLGLKTASRMLLNLNMITYDEITGGLPFSELPVSKAMEYAPVDADHTLRLFNYYQERSHLPQFSNLHVNDELTPVVVTMERKGFHVDVEGMEQWRVELEANVERLKAQLNEDCGFPADSADSEHVNWASGQQVANILFNRLGLEPQKNNSTGFAVDVDTLTILKGQHPAIETLMNLRSTEKALGTYAEPFIARALASPAHRIYPRWHRSGTKTNRMSSSKPNGMNIPPAARQYITAPDGHLLFGADYGQIELRIPAALSGDPALCADFRNGESPHLRTFSAIFGKTDKSAYPAEYTLSKNINFSVLYFSGPTNIIDYAREAGIHLSFSEAADMITQHKRTYPILHQWLWARVEEALKNGYTDTLQGHRAWYPDLFSSDPARKAAAYREAVNHIIQGTAGGFTKEAMIDFNAICPDTLIFNVHDELDGEAPEADAPRHLEVLVNTMKHTATKYITTIPIEVEGKMGKTWKELK